MSAREILPMAMEDCHNCGQREVCTWDGHDWLCAPCVRAAECAAQGHEPSDHMPAYDQYVNGRLCGNCGTAVPGKRTAVIDWREDWLCASCIASFDWSDWTYDASTDTYRHN